MLFLFALVFFTSVTALPMNQWSGPEHHPGAPISPPLPINPHYPISSALPMDQYCPHPGPPISPTAFPLPMNQLHGSVHYPAVILPAAPVGYVAITPPSKSPAIGCWTPVPGTVSERCSFNVTSFNWQVPFVFCYWDAEKQPLFLVVETTSNHTNPSGLYAGNEFRSIQGYWSTTIRKP